MALRQSYSAARPEKAIANSLQEQMSIHALPTPPVFLSCLCVLGRACKSQPKSWGEAQGEGRNILAFWII